MMIVESTKIQIILTIDNFILKLSGLHYKSYCIHLKTGTKEKNKRYTMQKMQKSTELPR